MNQQRRQYLVWIVIALIALVGIGSIAFLAGRLSLSGVSTNTPTVAVPTNTPLPPPPPPRTGP